MAVEELFISSALNSLGYMAVFLYLFHASSDSKFWKKVWLSGVFLIMLYSISVERYAWQYDAVSTQLDNLSSALLQVIMWVLVTLITYVVISVLLMLIQGLVDMVSGKKEAREHGEAI